MKKRRKIKIKNFVILFFFLSIFLFITNYPKLTLNGEDNITINVFTEYTDSGYNMNKRLLNIGKVNIESNLDTNIIGNYTIKYTIKYFGINIEKERYITVVDKDNPTINLEGDNISLYLNGSYQEPGYTATDNYDGDITDKVTIENNIKDEPGNYEINYTVIDSSGNTATIKRNVERLDYNKGVIYLTFDDGPSNSTSQILDILDKYNVKATFFVINFQDGYNDVVKRAYDSGHTIALHSYSHKYATIYSSVDAYFNDLNAISNRVYEVTGNKSMIMRFPGGASNTISSFNKGIMSTLTKMVKEKGYHYFDWNVDSDDAGSARSSDDVYNNVMNAVRSNRNNVVLMHDFANNNKTIGALDKLISDLLSEGFVFKPITMDTSVVQHGVNN